MNDLSLVFEIEKPKIISTNEAYMHPVRKCKDGRYRSYVCKSPDLKDFQEFYKEVLQEKIPDDKVVEFKKYIEESLKNTLDISITYGLPENEIFKHDASNFIKALEDCISTRLGIDDSKNSRVSVTKTVYNSFTSDWILRIKIVASKVENYKQINL